MLRVNHLTPKLMTFTTSRKSADAGFNSAQAQSQQKIKECSAVGATGVRVDLRARKGASTLLSPGDGATYRRDGESILHSYLKKASSSCTTIPSIEKTIMPTMFYVDPSAT